jgi:putative flavoprotein involved in K+ transport
VRTTTVVIGAGHTGLAVSHYLTSRSIDHVVIERGEVANAWRTKRWDSLRLLTPSFQTRLPGLAWETDDPDGFMTVPEVVAFIDRYASVSGAPLRTQTTVLDVDTEDGGYRVTTDQGTWHAPTVMLATGGSAVPNVPSLVGDVPAGIVTITPDVYRRPFDLPIGGVLVVGASASGVQLADELQRSGRPVTLSVGEHVRMPRRYRGRDIMWWLSATGLHDQRIDEIDDLVRARAVPSPQLVGTPERSDLDLNALTSRGVRLVGRLGMIRDGTALFSGSLANKTSLADLKLGRLLDGFDAWATAEHRDDEFEPPERPAPTVVDTKPPLMLDLGRAGIASIVWATGFRPDHAFLRLPVLDHKGRLRHDGGVVTDAPGLYAIGLNLLRRRKSSFIHGADDDARELVDHLATYLAAAHVAAAANSSTVSRSHSLRQT